MGFLVDRDEILVGLREGLFSRLLIEVESNDLEMLRVVAMPTEWLTRFPCATFSRAVREGRAVVKVYGL